MLRELIEITWLEDFVSGLARSSRCRICVYDAHGDLIVASAGNNEFARLTGHAMNNLPAKMTMTPVPAHDPPARVSFVESRGVWYVVAPVYVDDHEVGFVAAGEFREQKPAGSAWEHPDSARSLERATLMQAWESLAPLDRSVQSHPVIVARWGARQLAEWGRREARLAAATAEVALVGDIAALLTGKQDLQEVLNRLVAETARVMDCPFASIRLYDAKTNRLTIKAVHNLSPEYVDKGAVIRTDNSVADRALRGEIVYIEDVANDPRTTYPDEARREGIVSMLTAGMIYRGSAVGILRVYTNRRRRFRKAQRDLLRAVAYQAATAIVHAQLVEERLQNAETQRQLALAGDLQERMIRGPAPNHPLVETAFAFHPTFEVAGDFCDRLELCDHRLVALVGDVVGKGIPASLLMSTVRGALRSAAAFCLNPAELLTQLNKQIEAETLPREFVTLLLVAIDRDARRLTYANAGHEPLLLLRDGEVHTVDDADLVLGVDPTLVYREQTLDLRPDDLLLLYTDGACEARNFADELFTRERLHKALREFGQLPLQQVLDNIIWDVRRFVGLAEQVDDLTLVGLRVRAPGSLRELAGI